MDHQKQITQQMDPSVYDVVKEEVLIKAESNKQDFDLDICHNEESSELVKEAVLESACYKLNHMKEKS